jgi:flavin-dependent dehydrogenase
MARSAHPETFDVVVVGGRVAGAIVAALLGDRGVRTLLIERIRFPAPTISTHFFRGSGLVAVLDRLGVLDEVLALGPPPITHEWSFGFGSPGPDEGRPHDAGEIGFGLSVRRAPLDEVLLRRAARPQSVTVVQPATVTELLRGDGRVTGVRFRDAHGEREATGRIVVGADGRRSLVAAAVRPALQHHAGPLRTLYYGYVSGWRGPSGEPPDAAEFSLNGDEMAYVFPSDAGLTCVGVSAPKRDFHAFRKAPSDELARRIAMHGFAGRYDASTPVGRPAGGSPEPSWVRVPCGAGWALVGDAGLHQDPWTGAGMDTAAQSGAALADSLASWLSGATGEDEALAQYHAARDQHALATWHDTTRYAADLSQLASNTDA